MASKVVKQLAGSGAGQSLADRVNAAKYSLAGSGLGKGVVKATTEELIPPKKKHLDYLTGCTNEVNVSIPELAEFLIDRMQQTSWVVVLKAFITTHHLLNFGNEKFSQYLAAKNNQMYLPNFIDKTSSISYEMSQYVKIYSKYVNEKTITYRLMAFDFCKIKRGKDDGVLRKMPLDKLMKTLPILQGQIDVLLEFDINSKDLNNPVLNSAFTLLYKDLIRLYASYNEGMINLIEQYFTMSRKMCIEALAMYKGFLDRQEKVTKFSTAAENAGVGDKASLGLQAVPPKVLQTLENHLANLEKRKKSESDTEEAKEPSTGTVKPPAKAEKNESTARPKKSNEASHQPQKPAAAEKPSENVIKADKLLDDLHAPQKHVEPSENKAPVHTQLRRPEQQQSVAVTVKRTGRSPSPARPPRPMAPPSRESSPVRQGRSESRNDADTDLFDNLRDEPPNHLDIAPTTPNDGRVSPFAADEKPIEDGGSFWTSGIVESLAQKADSGIDFDTAFKEEKTEVHEPEAKPAEPNLFELDLLGLGNDDEQVKPVPPANEPKTQTFADLDDLFGLGSADGNLLSDTPLAPAAVVAKPVSNTTDDLLGSFSMTTATTLTTSKSMTETSPITPIMQNVKPLDNSFAKTPQTAKPQKSADSGLSDTLAALAQSLGKTETKWSSTSKPQTLAGKTMDSLGMSSGSTMNWNQQAGTTAASVTSTNADTSANNTTNDLLDLLG